MSEFIFPYINLIMKITAEAKGKSYMGENTKKKLLLMGAVLIAVDFSDGNMIIRSYPSPVC